MLWTIWTYKIGKPSKRLRKNKCSFKNCFNSLRSNLDIHLFRFPTNNEICEQWVINSGKKHNIFKDASKLEHEYGRRFFLPFYAHGVHFSMVLRSISVISKDRRLRFSQDCVTFFLNNGCREQHFFEPSWFLRHGVFLKTLSFRTPSVSRLK